MQGLKSMGGGEPHPDPYPKHYVMHMYTCPNQFVFLPPAHPPAEDEVYAQAVVIDRASMEVCMYVCMYV